LLLRSPVLEQAERWIASRPKGAPAPTEETQAYISRSRQAATRRRNILTGSLAAGLVMALGLAGIAYWQRGQAVEQRGISEAQRDRADEGQHEVRERAGERDRAHAERRPEARLVEGHRFPVAEPRENDQQRPERIEVRHRVQAQSAEQARGVVAEARRRVRVHEFVDGDPKEDRDHESDERDGVLRGSLDRRDEPTRDPPVQEEKKSDEEQRVDRPGS